MIVLAIYDRRFCVLRILLLRVALLEGKLHDILELWVPTLRHEFSI